MFYVSRSRCYCVLYWKTLSDILYCNVCVTFHTLSYPTIFLNTANCKHCNRLFAIDDYFTCLTFSLCQPSNKKIWQKFLFLKWLYHLKFSVIFFLKRFLCSKHLKPNLSHIQEMSLVFMKSSSVVAHLCDIPCCLTLIIHFHCFTDDRKKSHTVSKCYLAYKWLIRCL